VIKKIDTMDKLKEIAEQCLQRENTFILKDSYMKLFQLTLPLYDFPTLTIDEQGLITGKCKLYQKYDCFEKDFRIINKPHEELDSELEKAIIENNITHLDIDLNKSSKGYPFFDSHDCSVYPELVKDIPVLYDTLYICDYYLKFIYGVLLKQLVLERTGEQVIFSNFLIAYRELEGKFTVSSINERTEFLKLLDSVKLFVSENSVYKDEIRKSYEICRANDTQIIINLSYRNIEYTTDEHCLYFEPLVPNLKISYGQEQVPYYLTFVKKFIEKCYEDIKSAFPIYHRLENMYRLCGLMRFREKKEICDFHLDIPKYSCVFTRKFPDRIMCCGGVELAPKEFKRSKSECRQFFDQGGLICAFAPKLQIRNCYETNLKNYHDCLSLEEIEK
jgi:hypothetical protein